MAICNRCIHYEKVWSDERGWVWKCAARCWQVIIPECLSNWETQRIVSTGKCRYFAQKDDSKSD